MNSVELTAFNRTCEYLFKFLESLAFVRHGTVQAVTDDSNFLLFSVSSCRSRCALPLIVSSSSSLFSRTVAQPEIAN